MHLSAEEMQVIKNWIERANDESEKKKKEVHLEIKKKYRLKSDWCSNSRTMLSKSSR